MDYQSFVLGLATGGLVGTFFWMFALLFYFPHKFERAGDEINAVIQEKEEKYSDMIEGIHTVIQAKEQEYAGMIDGIERKVSQSFDNKVEELFTKLKDPDNKELYALSAMLLWRFLSVMEEPDIKKVIHAKIIGYTRAYGPQFFEAIKSEAAKQYPIIADIPTGATSNNPNAWMSMVPEEYRETIQGFLPLLQLFGMGKK
jgi:hypothetical protein